MSVRFPRFYSSGMRTRVEGRERLAAVALVVAAGAAAVLTAVLIQSPASMDVPEARPGPPVVSSALPGPAPAAALQLPAPSPVPAPQPPVPVQLAVDHQR